MVWYSIHMAVQRRRFKTKQTVKIADFLRDMGLSEAKFQYLLRETNIRITEGQKNLGSSEVARIRSYLNEQKRREELRGQTIAIPSIVKVQDLAKKLELPVGNVLQTLLKNGVLANLNDDLDYETAAIISEELGYQTEEAVQELEKDALTQEKLQEILKKEDKKKQEERPPVVTILGHVDHGKTTLLDSIRSANVAGGEAGGITQAISGYQVDHKGRLITFIDTPGHETFEFMRERGARLADVVILVVAADDGVKPQTKQAAAYAIARKVPIVVAINKIDREQANVERVKKELAEIDLAPEEWGGKTTMVEISALKKMGLDDLLEMVLLTTDLQTPKADPSRPALATVVESHLDKHLGPLATVLVHTGTLHQGDDVVVGRASGRVRRLLDWRGKDIKRALPSTPVTIVGINDLPAAGDVLQVVEEKEEAAAKAEARRSPLKHIQKAEEGDARRTLAVVLKADSQGSLEALQQTINAMVPPEVRLSVIRADVGSISDSDVLTAKAAEALIYGFGVKAAGMSQKLADKEHVPVRLFDVIYHLVEDVRKEIEERMPVTVEREDIGRVKVLKVFFSTQKRKIVGGEVAEGFIEPGAFITIERNIAGGEKGEREVIGKGVIEEVQQEKKAVKRGEKGEQLGLTIEGKGKIKEGDVLIVEREVRTRKEYSGGGK